VNVLRSVDSASCVLEGPKDCDILTDWQVISFRSTTRWISSRVSRPRSDSVLVLLGFVILAFRVMWAARGILPIDDAFISFRYAANLAAGHGLVFNLGERVEGSTSFLWTLLLAGAIRGGIDPVAASRVLATLCTAGTMVALWAMTRSLDKGCEAGKDAHSRWLAGFPPLLFAAMGAPARLAATGMETMLFTLLVTVLFFGAELARRRGNGGLAALAGSSAALAAMARPEGLLYGCLAGCHLAAGALSREGRRGSLRRSVVYTVAFLGVYGPYFLWRFRYYGYLLPNTFYAKVGVPWPSRIATGWDKLLAIGSLWGILPLLLLALLAVPSARREPLWKFSFLVLGASVASFVLVGGDFLIFFGPRFLMPALPLLLLLDAEALRHAVRFLRGERWRQPVAAALAVALVSYGFWFTWPAKMWRFESLEQEHRAWLATGQWLRDHAQPSSTVATSAAGIIPFVSRLPAIDMFGLTDEHIAHEGIVDVAMPPGHQKSDPGYVMRRRPDYLVDPHLSEEGIPVTARLGWVSERIGQDYRLVAQVKTRKGAPPDDRWVVEVEGFNPRLYGRGYRMGIFRRVIPGSSGG